MLCPSPSLISCPYSFVCSHPDEEGSRNRFSVLSVVHLSSGANWMGWWIKPSNISDSITCFLSPLDSTWANTIIADTNTYFSQVPKTGSHCWFPCYTGDLVSVLKVYYVELPTLAYWSLLNIVAPTIAIVISDHTHTHTHTPNTHTQTFSNALRRMALLLC
jgi:hypothetical protein